MTGAIVKFSPFSESATRLPHSSAPVSVLRASRNPSGVARTTRPSLRATPRLRSHRTSPRGRHVCRHFTRQLAASSAIVLLDVVRYIVPSCTRGPVWKLSRSPTWKMQAGASRETFAVLI